MYTFKPKQKFAKASGTNMNISAKTAAKICRVIRNKKLTQVKRLLDDLLGQKRSLNGKYHTKTVKEIKMLLESCEKNAEFQGLNTDALFVHASAHQGNAIRRRRRKSAFGSKLKATNLEIMLIEKGRVTEKKKLEKKKEVSAKVKEKLPEDRKERQVPKEGKAKVEEKKVSEKEKELPEKKKEFTKTVEKIEEKKAEKEEQNIPATVDG